MSLTVLNLIMTVFFCGLWGLIGQIIADPR
jgi:hypothetical protein